jgi:hypothetical protein
MAEVIVKKDGVESIEFFGKADMNKKGEVGSYMPSWYLRSNKEELENGIEQTEKAIERGEIIEDKKPQTVSDLKKMKEKLSMINASQPRVKGAQEDIVHKASEELGAEIAASMFTLSDMKRGTADAHEEARRMADPCIKLSGEALALAEKAGARIYKGMVSRTDAEKTWKLCRRVLGENSNSEILRRQ